jgi:hypothetical protein
VTPVRGNVVTSYEIAFRLWKQSGYLNGWLKGQKPHRDNTPIAGIRIWYLQNMEKVVRGEAESFCNISASKN